MDEGLMTIDDYLEILKRRKWSLILPVVAVCLISAMIALLLPSVYKSTATILIEEQEFPANCKAAVTVTPSSTCNRSNQRIMSSNKLLEIVIAFTCTRAC
jgi:uncharacterized protein involved in exopolysaccharide biosynthesis